MKEIASHCSITKFLKPALDSPVPSPVPSVSDSLSTVPHSSLELITLESVAQSSPTSSLNTFIISEATSRAEILLALKCIWSHYSYRSCEDIQELWSAMFPDSEIAKKLTLGKTKIAYIVAFGLAHHFSASLFKTVQLCPYFVVCFDEAFNRISQRCQMDIVVRFCDDSNGLVQTR